MFLLLCLVETASVQNLLVFMNEWGGDKILPVWRVHGSVGPQTWNTKGIECRIGGPRLPSPAPTLLQSWLWTSCLMFSNEPASFPYVPPSPSNRHSSCAFGDDVWCVLLYHILILFFCILGDVVWWVVVSVTYLVLVFFGRRCLVRGCVCYLYRFRVFWGGKENGSAYCGTCCGLCGSC